MFNISSSFELIFNKENRYIRLVHRQPYRKQSSLWESEKPLSGTIDNTHETAGTPGLVYRDPGIDIAWPESQADKPGLKESQSVMRLSLLYPVAGINIAYLGSQTDKLGRIESKVGKPRMRRRLV